MTLKNLIMFTTLYFNMATVPMSCIRSSESDLKTSEITLNCEIRNWEERIIISMPKDFFEWDSLPYFWPISPEAHNRVYKADSKNTYIIIKYCEYHYEGVGSIATIANNFLEKIQDAGAKKLSSELEADFFISEHIVYHGYFNHEVYLVTKIFKTKDDIVTIFGLNSDHFLDSINSSLYHIVQETEFSPR